MEDLDDMVAWEDRQVDADALAEREEDAAQRAGGITFPVFDTAGNAYGSLEAASRRALECLAGTDDGTAMLFFPRWDSRSMDGIAPCLEISLAARALPAGEMPTLIV